jgi:hypothetical protein
MWYRGTEHAWHAPGPGFDPQHSQKKKVSKNKGNKQFTNMEDSQTQGTWYSRRFLKTFIDHETQQPFNDQNDKSW